MCFSAQTRAPFAAKLTAMKQPAIPAIPAVPVAKTLTEQKSDFTAEGSPPPGMVSTSVPAAAPDPGKASGLAAKPIPRSGAAEAIDPTGSP
jgi:hypothetical protein